MKRRIQGFLEGGGLDFQKFFEKFVDLSFLVDQIDFWISPEALKSPCFGQMFCATGKLW